LKPEIWFVNKYE